MNTYVQIILIVLGFAAGFILVAGIANNRHDKHRRLRIQYPDGSSYEIVGYSARDTEKLRHVAEQMLHG